MVDNRAVWNCTKDDTQPRHVKHESRRGFKRKSFRMDNTNRLADKISELKKLANGKATNRKKKMCRRKQGRIAERSKEPGSRKSSVENSGTRMCAWVRIPLLSENILNTMRQSLWLTNSVTLERQFKMTVQSKRKRKNRKVVWGWQSSCLKLHKIRYPDETCNTRMYALR